MKKSQDRRPLKGGKDPHRAFQCLETIYVSEQIADKIKVGDKVYWDFDRGELRVGDIFIWKIPVRSNRYYGCIDSYRHEVVSWISAKEGRKLKVFTSVDLKRPYGKTLNPTESEKISRNINIILPRLTKTIGKGFWQIFDDESIPSVSILRLLNRVDEIKALADEIFLLDSFVEREHKINEIVVKIQQANADEIPRIKNEIISGPRFEIENIEKYWREKLSPRVWENLDDNVRHFITTGELVYRFLETVSIPNIDWTSTNVEFCKAIELELNKKIIQEFARWLKHSNYDGLTTLLSMFNWRSDRAEWRKFVDFAKKSKKPELTLGTIQWLFKNLADFSSNESSKLTPFEKKLLFLLEDYIGGLNANSSFFDEFPNILKELVITRNGGLHTKFLEKEKVDRFISKLEMLLPEITALGP